MLGVNYRQRTTDAQRILKGSLVFRKYSGETDKYGALTGVSYNADATST